MTPAKEWKGEPAGGAGGAPPRPRIAIFAPHPLLAVTLEREGPEREQVHFHSAGQGVWVARMAGCMGAQPVLCGLIGGESGDMLLGLGAKVQELEAPFEPESGAYGGGHGHHGDAGHGGKIHQYADPGHEHEH